MVPKPHEVKNGDTLWKIIKQELGVSSSTARTLIDTAASEGQITAYSTDDWMRHTGQDKETTCERLARQTARFCDNAKFVLLKIGQFVELDYDKEKGSLKVKIHDGEPKKENIEFSVGSKIEVKKTKVVAEADSEATAKQTPRVVESDEPPVRAGESDEEDKEAETPSADTVNPERRRTDGFGEQALKDARREFGDTDVDADEPDAAVAALKTPSAEPPKAAAEVKTASAEEARPAEITVPERGEEEVPEEDEKPVSKGKSSTGFGGGLSIFDEGGRNPLAGLGGGEYVDEGPEKRSEGPRGDVVGTAVTIGEFGTEGGGKIEIAELKSDSAPGVGEADTTAAAIPAGKKEFMTVVATTIHAQAGAALSSVLKRANLKKSTAMEKISLTVVVTPDKKNPKVGHVTVKVPREILDKIGDEVMSQIVASFPKDISVNLPSNFRDAFLVVSAGGATLTYSSFSFVIKYPLPEAKTAVASR